MALKSEIAPKGMEFKPTEFVLGGKYSTIMTIVSFPKNIYPGYLSDLTNIQGVKVAIKHIPIQFSVLQKMLNKEIDMQQKKIIPCKKELDKIMNH